MNLLRDIALFGMEKFFTILVSFSIVKILTSNMSLEQFGTYDLLFISSMLIANISSLGLGSAINREVSLNDNMLTDVIRTSFNIFIISVILIVFVWSIYSIFFELHIVIILITIMSLVVIIFTNIIRCTSSSGLFLFSSIIQGSIYLILIFSTNDYSYSQVLYYYSLSILIQVMIFIIYYKDVIKMSFSLSYNATISRSMLKFGLPVVLINLSSFIFNYSDRYIIASFSGVSDVAIYAILYKISSVIMIVGGIFQMVWPQWAFKVYKNEDNVSELFNMVFRLYICILIVLAFLVTSFSRELILLISSGDYQGNVFIIPILVLGMIFNSIINLVAISIHIKSKVMKLTFLTLFSGGINIILNVIFIPYYGIVAAALTTLISMLILFISVNYISKNIIDFDYSVIRLILAIMIFIQFVINVHDVPILIDKVQLIFVNIIVLSVVLFKKDDFIVLKRLLKC